jgi:hypothetical protein
VIKQTDDWTLELRSGGGRWFGWHWELRGPQGPLNPDTGLWPPQFYTSGYASTRRGAITEARRVMRRLERSTRRHSVESITLDGAE